MQRPWCPGTSPSPEVAGEGYEPHCSLDFSLTDWQKQEFTATERLTQSLPFRLTLPAPGWLAPVETQSLTTELVHVPTSAKIVTGANCKSFGIQAQWGATGS